MALKMLDVIGTGVRKVKAATIAVAKAMQDKPKDATRDPFLLNAEHRAELEDAGPWIRRRRRGWFR